MNYYFLCELCDLLFKVFALRPLVPRPLWVTRVRRYAFVDCSLLPAQHVENDE